MPLDFPSSPTDGQSWTGSNGVTYVWDGIKWVAQVGGAGGPFLPLAGGTLTGSLLIDGFTGNLPALGINETGPNWATIFMNTAPTDITASPNSASNIRGQKNGLDRWSILMPDTEGETGGNVGSNLKLYRSSDTGGDLDTDALITLVRSTGQFAYYGPELLLFAPQSTNGAAATRKDYVDAAVAATRTFQGSYNAATNTPNLLTLTPSNGDYLLVGVAGTIPAGVAGIGGQAVNIGDMIIFSTTTNSWSIIPATGLTLAQGDARYLQLTGGTLTGPLLLNADPTSALGAATKEYVDAAVGTIGAGVTSFNGRTGAITLASIDVINALGFTPYNATNPAGFQTAAQVAASLGNYLPLSGGTLTGPLTLNADPTSALQAATKEYVDNHAGIAAGIGTNFFYPITQAIPANVAVGTVYNFTIPASIFPAGNSSWMIPYDASTGQYASWSVIAINGLAGFTSTFGYVQLLMQIYVDLGDGNGLRWVTVGHGVCEGASGIQGINQFVLNSNENIGSMQSVWVRHAAGATLSLRLTVEAVSGVTAAFTVTVQFGGRVVLMQ